MVQKADARADRPSIEGLTEIINIGPSIADDLRRIGVRAPKQLIGADPWTLYCRISAADRQIQDPCLLDVLMASVDYMNGGRPQTWWKFTATRKKTYGDRLKGLTLERLSRRNHRSMHSR
jgi:hypothetical protein